MIKNTYDFYYVQLYNKDNKIIEKKIFLKEPIFIINYSYETKIENL